MKTIEANEVAEDLRNTVAELRSENQRLLTVLNGTLDRETLLQYLNVHDGAIDLGVSPPQFVMRILAEMFAFSMDDAPNFQTANLALKAGQFEMTIRRVEGKTPAQTLSEMRPVVDAAKAWRHGFDGPDAPCYPSIQAEDLEDVLNARLAEAVDLYEKST